MSNQKINFDFFPACSEISATGLRRSCRIILADDCRMLLDMLRQLLEPEFSVVGAATDAGSLIEMARRSQPDIAMIDALLETMAPCSDLINLHRTLREIAPSIRLVYLGVCADEQFAMRMFELGASAFLLKSETADDLQKALRAVAAGGKWLTPQIAGGNPESLSAVYQEKPMIRLSSRELEVLKLSANGLTMKTIARRLEISPRTVAFHKYRAMHSLGLQGHADLVAFAVSHGMLERGGPG